MNSLYAFQNLLPRYQSDHNVLILNSIISRQQSTHTRFEKFWIGDPEFEKLLKQWWESFRLEDDLGNS
jgi:hypothetical protein